MTKIILCLVAALALIAVAERPSVSLQALSWTAITEINFPVQSIATQKDLFVHVGADQESELPFINIRRRNNAGEYVSVANFTKAVESFIITNGKWVVLLDQERGNNSLFSVDANNKVSESSHIATTNGGFILSDDTFVGLVPNEPANISTIMTYEYSATNKEWSAISGTDLQIPGIVRGLGAILPGYRASDTHLLVAVPYNGFSRFNLNLYERLANRSWNLTDSFPVNNTGLVNMAYNGVDTIAYFLFVPDGEYFGVTHIFTKINGAWVEQVITAESVGYRPVGYLGYQMTFRDADTLLLTAPGEGVSVVPSEPKPNYGKVLMLTRNADGEWEPLLDMASPSGNFGYFGVGVETNDYDMVVASINSLSQIVQYYAVPRCFTDPMDVTCNDQQVEDCSTVALNELYTVNNPQCGAVSATVSGLGLVNNQALAMQFTFTRGYGADFSCNATVTCPAPPAAPVVSTAPVAPEEQISAAQQTTLSLVTLVAVAALV